MRGVQGVPIVNIDLLYGRFGCTKGDVCRKYENQLKKRLVGRYVGEKKPFPGQIQSAIIDLRGFSYDDYMKRVREVHKGAALRQSKKSYREGYYCKRFVWKNFIPDIVEINQSKEVRSGGRMRVAYRRSVEEMGGAPKNLVPLKEPPCPVHCTHCWGIFEHNSGYRQGDVVTEEKLLAYIKFKRNGNIAIYTSILGHGDYLKYGIIYRLHYGILEWVGENLSGALAGLEYLMYGSVNSGGQGLQQWKKRALYKGAYLVLDNQAVGKDKG